MSQDPFQEREAEKYESPIPSREFILELLTKRSAPAKREEIAQLLNLFRRRVRSLTPPFTSDGA